jgi:hypothetical protein
MSTVFLLALPILASCSDAVTMAPTGPRLEKTSPATAQLAGSVRPAGGSCDTDITVLPPLAGYPANVLRLHIDYGCQLRHLGRTTASVEQIVVFTGPTTATASNTGTYTAANGDQLFASWTGTATINGPAITFSGPETIAGGTGRFTNASGSTWVEGTASFVTSTGQFTSVGTVSY